MRSRPLVDLQLSLPPDEVLARFRACLDTGECTCEGHVGRTELSLVLRGETRHTFSPWLSVQTFPWEGGTRLRGRFGPHPDLWTLFVMVYSLWAFAFVMGSMLGYVQLVMGMDPWGLYVALAAALAQGIFCSIDLYGRAQGAKQMHIVRSFVSSTLPEAHDVPDDAPLPHQVGL